MKRVIIGLLLSIVAINLGTVLLMVISHKSQTPMDKLFGGMPGTAILVASILLCFAIYFLAVVLALYHIASNSKFTTTQKLLWFLLILLVHVIGLVAYLLWGDSLGKQNQKATNV